MDALAEEKMAFDRPYNPSGLEPCGRAVLVKPYEPEQPKGRLVLPDSVQQGMRMLEQRAVVIAVGENAWYDEPSPRAAVGDHVLVGRFTGFIAGKGITADGEEYRLVTDRDIFCRLVQS